MRLVKWWKLPCLFPYRSEVCDGSEWDSIERETEEEHGLELTALSILEDEFELDYLDSFMGLCVMVGDTRETFASFDVERNKQFSLSFMPRKSDEPVFCGQPKAAVHMPMVTPTSMITPSLTPTARAMSTPTETPTPSTTPREMLTIIANSNVLNDPGPVYPVSG